MIAKAIIALAMATSTTTTTQTNLEPDFDRLLAVQKRVNLTVAFQPEDPGQDVWRIPDINGYGDCEDFALLKRKILIESGWNPEDLRLLLVYTKPRNSNNTVVSEGHIVLYIQSLNLILDAPSQWNQEANLYPIKYNTYMNERGYTLYCKINNIALGSEPKTASQRCKPVHPGKPT